MTHLATGNKKYNTDDKEHDENSLQILYILISKDTVHKKERTGNC